MEHMRRVYTVLSRINSAELKLRPEKCHLLQTEVTFLSHIASKDGVRPDLTNADWPRPSNKASKAVCRDRLLLQAVY
jgi:hypothetical protein